MIARLPKGAHWNNVPLDEMNCAELKLILAYKMYELEMASEVMNESQRAAVKQAMKDVHVPVIVRRVNGRA